MISVIQEEWENLNFYLGTAAYFVHKKWDWFIHTLKISWKRKNILSKKYSREEANVLFYEYGVTLDIIQQKTIKWKVEFVL